MKLSVVLQISHWGINSFFVCRSMYNTGIGQDKSPCMNYVYILLLKKPYTIQIDIQRYF